MRFHLVDRIVAFVPWKEATGIKNITVADELLEYSSETHSMVFPKPLLCECILQTCAWLIVKSSECKKRPVILKFDNIEFFSNACVGDTVELIVKIVSYTDDTATVSGYANVGSKKMLCFNECLISLLDTGSLESPEDTEIMIKCLFREE